MQSPLEQVTQLEYFVRQLMKVDSKMNAGQFIAAYRENRRIIAELEKVKSEIIDAEKNPAEKTNEK